MPAFLKRSTRYGATRQRAIILLTFIAALCLNFWLGSRYPSLDRKAAMGVVSAIEPLGFNTVLTAAVEASAWVRVLVTTVNWLETNRQGMIFGVLLGGGLMALVTLWPLNRLSAGRAYGAGLLMGAPLGVCVNCAAPIARGLHGAGARLETSLASMFSAPALNVIVLTMLFTTLPFHVAAAKLGVTIFFLLCLLPLVAKIESAPGRHELALDEEVCAVDAKERWWDSLGWSIKTYARCLWFIVRTTVPLMFLAGFLGAVLVTLLPWETLVELLPALPDSYAKLIAMMFGVAAVGLFLPVPIAFDVVIASALLSAGLPARFVTPLLFCLGIYSVYSFSIVWSSMSRRIAVMLAIVLLPLGVLAGMIADVVDIRLEKTEDAEILKHFSVTRWRPAPEVFRAPYAGPTPGSQPIPEPVEHTPVVRPSRWVAGQDGVRVLASRYAPSPEGRAETSFVARDGVEVGVVQPWRFQMKKQLSPYSWMRPIASADVHGDGWPDLLIGRDLGIGGVSVYANQGDGRFREQPVDVPELMALQVVMAALVDVNGDGRADLFASTYRSGNHLVLSDAGRFHAGGYQRLPDADAVAPVVASFGDLDSDGDVDIVLGNLTTAVLIPGNYSMARSKNIWLEQQADGSFVERELRSTPGESLTGLIFDVNRDGIQDVLLGNDMMIPDELLIGDGEGGLRLARGAEALIERSTISTMSISVADVDNDLNPELYFGQITRPPVSKADQRLQLAPNSCDDWPIAGYEARCRAELEAMMSGTGPRFGPDGPEQCAAIPIPEVRDGCFVNLILIRVRREQSVEDCELLRHRPDAARLCLDLFGASSDWSKGPGPAEAIPEWRDSNVFVRRQPDGRYLDVAEEVGHVRERDRARAERRARRSRAGQSRLRQEVLAVPRRRRRGRRPGRRVHVAAPPRVQGERRL